MTTDNKKKRSLARRIQNYLGTYRGQVYLNYAYNWGAAVVILGALFKLTHQDGANTMLWIGMGTEVLVFFISAFDLPQRIDASPSAQPNINIQVAGGSTDPQGTINIAAGGGGGVSQSVPQYAQDGAAVTSIPQQAGVQSAMAPGMEDSLIAYQEQLKEMTEALSRFAKQTDSAAMDSEQIAILNKNLAGINAIYEMQLRSVSSQIGTIDQVHEETRKMARQIEELNEVYARMLEAMNGNKKA
ncbi:gliding motility protein GldL [Bacteroides sp. 214]|uniref:type IX secretion system motor protein PorL/GldL n=1 Tax=Bacteroides sp. 214 TaxID=2302935 RepID=UPI0013CF6012|nr:gliding motility protein GldL [Bacteroides sp. 214]NDW13044.1 gliding motility protein GldL [Bacteroides sp. 214]